MRIGYFNLIYLLIVLVMVMSPSFAQVNEAALDKDSVSIIDEQANQDPMTSVRERINLVAPKIDILSVPSLFFTPSEQSLIQEARLGYTTRAPTPGEIRNAEDGSVPLGPRELALGGIIYSSRGDWSIWLNGQQITPKRLPPEILDISVRKDRIKLKWFDAYTNQIFPIMLKPHQRFNIDTRIFLPGEAKAD